MRFRGFFTWMVLLSHATLVSQAHAQPGQPGFDYPTDSLKAGEQGAVEFQVDVGVDGKATNCVIVKSSGYPRLDKATCDLVTRRARFNPATDKDGAPAKGTFKNKMNWVIPK